MYEGRVVADADRAAALRLQLPRRGRREAGQRGRPRVVLRPGRASRPASGRRRRPGRRCPGWRRSTTRVVNVASGPSTASAAAEVTSLVVEAGVMQPGPVLATAAPARWPRRPPPPTPAGRARPRTAGRPAPTAARSPSAASRSAAARAQHGRPGRARAAAATVGTLRAASRGGSIRATVMPGREREHVDHGERQHGGQLRRPAVARRSMTYHLTRCLPQPGGTMELITRDPAGANQWTLTLLSRSPWDSGTSTRWTTTPAGSGWTACSSPRPGTRRTTASSRTPWPTTAIRWTRWCFSTNLPSPAA